MIPLNAFERLAAAIADQFQETPWGEMTFDQKQRARDAAHVAMEIIGIGVSELDERMQSTAQRKAAAIVDQQ